LLKGLPTYCQHHPDDDDINLSTVEEFRTSRPHGGCHRVCNYRMNCGHACRLSCHPYDRDHDRSQRNCCEPCRRVPPDCHMNHRCPELCKENCGPCQTQVGPVRLNCGHSRELVYCHDTRDEKAIDLLTKTCQQPVQHTFKICGHVLLTACANSSLPQPVCPGKCGKSIEKCGHPCVRECGSCVGRDHLCGQLCERKMFCGHICGRPCHVGSECPPCRQPCAVVCSHSHCPKRCHVPVSNLRKLLANGQNPFKRLTCHIVRFLPREM